MLSFWLPFTVHNFSITDGVPYDGVPENEVVTVHTSVTVIFVLMATAGLIFTILCLIFNFVFRKRKLVFVHWTCDFLLPCSLIKKEGCRPGDLIVTMAVVMMYSLGYHNVSFFMYRIIQLSSPNLNYLIGFGAILFFLDAYLLVTPASYQTVATVVCNVS